MAHESFNQAVDDVYQTIIGQGFATHEQVRFILNGLARYVAASYVTFSPEDSLDVGDDALGRWTKAVKEGVVERARASAYLVGIARKVAKGLIRSQREELIADPDLTEAMSADEIASLVDRRASNEIIRNAFRDALADGRDETVRIMSYWLNEAERLGRDPSDREVAAAAGVTHPTVARHLEIFRDYLST